MAQPSVAALTPVEKPAREYVSAIEAKKWSVFFSSETVIISILNWRVITSVLIGSPPWHFMHAYDLLQVTF